jgi:predicted nucleotidyltransferase component of viral defense system
VRYASPAAFRAALDDRLKTEAKSTGLGLARLRKRVAFELFLRRLVAVAPERWVLKGALALDFRLGSSARPSKDIDIERTDTEEAAIEDLTAAQQLAMDDYFSFIVVRTDGLDDTDDFAAVRFHVDAELAARIFEQFTIDVAFVSRSLARPETIHTTRFLTFAGIEPVRIPAVPIHQHLAEKVHAYTRAYGKDERRSTRPKDLVDILVIESAEPIGAARLRKALESTFEARGTHPLPSAFPPPPASWAAAYAKLARETAVEPDLNKAFVRAAAVLDPVLDGSAKERWDAAAGAWVASSPS